MDNKLILDWGIPFDFITLKKRFDFTNSDMNCVLGVNKDIFDMMKMYFLDERNYCNEVYVYWGINIPYDKAQLLIQEEM